jgi:hypothetical protein
LNGRPTGGVVHQWNIYLELKLTSTASAALDACLSDGRITPDISNLIAPAGTIPQQPVQRMPDGVIRVFFGNPIITTVTPGPERVAQFCANWTEMLPPRRETQRSFFNK